MLSRSSSSYQPLAQAVVGETVTPAIPRRNFSGHNASIRVQVTEDNNINYEENHEVIVIFSFTVKDTQVGNLGITNYTNHNRSVVQPIII